MSVAENLRLDASECLRLAELSTRENVRGVLSQEAEKLIQSAVQEEKKAAAKTTSNTIPHVTAIKVFNYGWDQSDKFVKLYVSLKNVHLLESGKVISTFQKKSVDLQVKELDNKSYSLVIKALSSQILPGESYHKVKTDMVVVFLKKAKTETWPGITESEKQAKEKKAPKTDDKGDVGSSLMTMMKQMYDEGDDEMKRTIAKAWTEARDKQGSEGPLS